jgi:hypothetical protein
VSPIYLSHALAFVIGIVSVRVAAYFYFRVAMVLRTDLERAQITHRLVIGMLHRLKPDLGLIAAGFLQLAAEIVREVEGEKREDFEERARLAWQALEKREALHREAERKSL